MIIRNNMNPRSTENIIILRSVFGKVGNKYFINPAKNPKTGLYPDCVKRVDSRGDMILTDAERNSDKPLIPEDRVFIIEDGTMFDLANPNQRAEWEAIEHCKLIAKSRSEKDSTGVNVIDGLDTRGVKSYKTAAEARYGSAELYVEIPGADTKRRITKKQILHNARTFIFEDDQESLVLKAKLLGRDVRYLPLADIQDFLLDIAERNPQRIIELYTGEDMNLRLLLMDALEKRVIINKDGVYTYSDSILMGATENAVLTWMKTAKNHKILELIRKDLNPELYEITNENALKVLKEKAAANKSKEK